MLQGMLVDAGPLKLFDVLSRYNDVDIGQIPEAGEALQSFFRRYYEFEQSTGVVEQESLKRIATSVQVRFVQGWRIYLRYVLLRFSGHSAEQVSSGNNFLNYDIAWTDAERVYGEVAKDAVMNRAFTGVFAQHNALRKDVEMLRRLVPVAR